MYPCSSKQKRLNKSKKIEKVRHQKTFHWRIQNSMNIRLQHLCRPHFYGLPEVVGLVREREYIGRDPEILASNENDVQCIFVQHLEFIFPGPHTHFQMGFVSKYYLQRWPVSFKHSKRHYPGRRILSLRCTKCHLNGLTRDNILLKYKAEQAASAERWDEYDYDVYGSSIRLRILPFSTRMA